MNEVVNLAMIDCCEEMINCNANGCPHAKLLDLNSSIPHDIFSKTDAAINHL